MTTETQIVRGLGIHHGVHFPEYASWPAINSGVVSAMMLSPKHGDCCLRGVLDRDDTTAMRFGRQLHLMLLEPERSATELVVADPCQAVLKSGDRKGQDCGATASHTDGAYWYCGKHVTADCIPSTNHLSHKEYDRAAAMIASVRASEANHLLRKPGWCEASMLFEWNGLTLKGRLDRLASDYSLIIDLKKIPAGRGTRLECQKRILEYGYHRQAAIYQRGVASLQGVTPQFAWVFVEDGPPYDVQVLVADEWDLEIGWDEVETVLKRHIESTAVGSFPGYLDGDKVELGALPLWFKQKYLKEHNLGAKDTYGDVPGTGDGVRAAGHNGADAVIPVAEHDPDNEWAEFCRNYSGPTAS